MTVPANLFVSTSPSVIGVGGADLVLNGMFLTNSTRVPIGAVAQFGSSDEVGNYFGGSSNEAAIAPTYFEGWNGSTQKPGNILFTQYPTTAVSAYLRGGDISDLALATLQSYNGMLTVSIDGYSRSSNINLSGATSFSNAATMIQTALNSSPASIASFTGIIGPASTILTASAVTGTIAAGQTVQGSGVAANTLILSQLSGTIGGAGTYQLSGANQTVNSESMTTIPTPVVVTYDSVSGAFVITSGITGPPSTAAFAAGALAPLLLLDQADGAVTSQGASAATPGPFMTALAASFSNWATFTTMFNPDNSGFANKQLFAEWTNTTNNRFAYSAWDTDAAPSASLPATGSFGYWLQQTNPSGTALHWNMLALAATLMGMVASVNFSQAGGRVTFAYKATGLTPTVTDETSFLNLAGNPQVAGSFGNGYNVYAAIASANATFQNYQRSTISGPFKWSDAYINAIWLSNAMQVALLNLFALANAIPFNAVGQGMIATALSDTIAQGLAFGAYAPGVLSGVQIAAVNADAGLDVAKKIQNQGYFLLIRPATATVRANRGPWQVVFYYLDNGSVQSINLATVALQ